LKCFIGPAPANENVERTRIAVLNRPRPALNRLRVFGAQPKTPAAVSPITFSSPLPSARGPRGADRPFIEQPGRAASTPVRQPARGGEKFSAAGSSDPAPSRCALPRPVTKPARQRQRRMPGEVRQASSISSRSDGNQAGDPPAKKMRAQSRRRRGRRRRSICTRSTARQKSAPMRNMLGQASGTCAFQRIQSRRSASVPRMTPPLRAKNDETSACCKASSGQGDFSRNHAERLHTVSSAGAIDRRSPGLSFIHAGK